MVNAVKENKWQEAMASPQASKRLLAATLAGDAQAAATGVQQAHNDNVSVLRYNDENSLACAVTLAYYDSATKQHTCLIDTLRH